MFVCKYWEFIVVYYSILRGCMWKTFHLPVQSNYYVFSGIKLQDVSFGVFVGNEITNCNNSVPTCWWMEISIGLLRVGELVMIDFQIFEDMIVPTYPRINVNLRRKNWWRHLLWSHLLWRHLLWRHLSARNDNYCPSCTIFE